ncbi:MAG: 2-oxoglutarate dehydrogenase E1 component [Phycisphaerales bacterium]
MNSTPRANKPSVNGWNAEYLEAQYASYKADPDAIAPDLASFFDGFDLAMSRTGGGGTVNGDDLRVAVGTYALIEAYRSRGHLEAAIDPFGRPRKSVAALTLAAHNLLESDLDRVVDAGTLALPAGSPATLRSVLECLRRTYCGPVGAQVAGVTSDEERNWLIARFEGFAGAFTAAPSEQAEFARQMIRSEELEFLLQKRYPGYKRFSLEGGESLVPALNALINAAPESGVEEIIVGMPHRGRVNILASVLGKSFEQVFTEYHDNFHGPLSDVGGDVPYHQGFSATRQTPAGKYIDLSLSPNPSHLESINGVVEGRVRGKQRLRRDSERRKVIPLLMHGDGAAIGQGVVAEVLNYSQLDGYTTGGTIHIAVNNLVAFTTGEEDGRTSEYCTDYANIIGAPVFHVTASDPDAAVAICRLALEYRQLFRKDIFIDFVCFRRYGHNEQDEISYTQPWMAEAVSFKKNAGLVKAYCGRLAETGVFSQQDEAAERARVQEALGAAFDRAKESPVDPQVPPGKARWSHIRREFSFEAVKTSVKEELLKEVCAAFDRVPEGFSVNPKFKKIIDERAHLLRTRQVSYADAETLAFGTLLLEGHGVRVSGQDSRRGTFSHRHAATRDMVTEEVYFPLNHMRAIADHPAQAGKPGPDGRPTQGRLCVHDSPLSEVSVLAFDYGYSMTDPDMLVCWEAQFGDFNNGAQVMMDQYFAASETKWQRWSGITLLLPHGYEGAGPEHSSARVERFLLLCAEHNLIVAYPSTGAQVFHLLRRQVKAPYRKPLIVMTPKSMLRPHTSTIDDLTRGSFEEVIDDPMFAGGNGAAGGDRKKVTRVVLCAGKIYHDLDKRRKETGVKNAGDTAIIRVEQLYPLHTGLLSKIIAAYPTKTKQFVWVQEEPRNAGAYLYMADALRNEPSLKIDLAYHGRPATASPAVGSKHTHFDQQAALVAAVFPDQPKPAPPAAPTNGPGKDPGQAAAKTKPAGRR